MRVNNITKRKPIIFATISSAFAVSIGLSPLASATENPFTMEPMEKGHMVVDASKHGDKKWARVKCDEGRCGAAMAGINKDA